MRAPSTLLLAACLVLAAVAGTAAGQSVQFAESRATPTVQGAGPDALPTATAPPSAPVTPPAAVGGPAGQSATEFAVVAEVPTEGGERRNVTVLAGADVASVGEVETGRNGLYRVPVTLTEAGAEGFVEDLRRLGFTDGGTTCDVDATAEDRGRCLHTVVDGEVVYSAGLSPGLAETMRSGEFADDPRFVFSAERRPQAQAIAMALADGTGDASAGDAAAAADATVAIVAEVPAADGGRRNVTVLTGEDIAAVSGTREVDGEPYVLVQLRDGSVDDFLGDLKRLGFAESGGTNCVPGESDGGCLHTVVDGEVVYTAGVNAGIARQFRTGEFAESPEMRYITGNESEARELVRSLPDRPEPTPPGTTETGTDAADDATATASPVAEEDEDSDGDSDGGSLPGFGALAALVALSAGALLVGRRR